MIVHRMRGKERKKIYLKLEGVVGFVSLLTTTKNDLNDISFIYLLNLTFYGKLWCRLCYFAALSAFFNWLTAA